MEWWILQVYSIMEWWILQVYGIMYEDGGGGCDHCCLGVPGWYSRHKCSPGLILSLCCTQFEMEMVHEWAPSINSSLTDERIRHLTLMQADQAVS